MELEKARLTPEELLGIRATIPGTDNVVDFAVPLSEKIANAQLSKAFKEVFEYLSGKCLHSRAHNALARNCVYCIDHLVEKLRKGEKP